MLTLIYWSILAFAPAITSAVKNTGDYNHHSYYDIIKNDKVIGYMKCSKTKNNETIEYIEQLEADGKALVIRPIRDVVVDRIERDVDKLTSFYEEGYACAKAAFEKK